MIVPDYALWIALFAIYLTEHVKLRGERVAVLALRRRGEARVLIGRAPLRLGGRHVCLLPPATVGETFYLGEFFADDGRSVRSGVWQAKKTRLIHGAVVPFLFLEPIMFGFYFVVCPLMTLVLGLGVTLRLIAPLHFAFVLVCGAMILRLPGLPARGMRRRLLLLAEIVISPGLMPALSKRLTSKVHLRADLPTSAGSHLNLRNGEQMGDTLRGRLEDLAQFGEAAPEDVEAYLSRLETAA